MLIYAPIGPNILMTDGRETCEQISATGPKGMKQV